MGMAETHGGLVVDADKIPANPYRLGLLTSCKHGPNLILLAL